MSNIDISGQAADVYDGQPDSFTSKPVSMVSLINKKKRVIREKRLLLGVPIISYNDLPYKDNHSVSSDREMHPGFCVERKWPVHCR